MFIHKLPLNRPAPKSWSSFMLDNRCALFHAPFISSANRAMVIPFRALRSVAGLTKPPLSSRVSWFARRMVRRLICSTECRRWSIDPSKNHGNGHGSTHSAKYGNAQPSRHCATDPIAIGSGWVCKPGNMGWKVGDQKFKSVILKADICSGASAPSIIFAKAEEFALIPARVQKSFQNHPTSVNRRWKRESWMANLNSPFRGTNNVNGSERDETARPGIAEMLILKWRWEKKGSKRDAEWKKQYSVAAEKW
jgi:hypothetical protein